MKFAPLALALAAVVIFFCNLYAHIWNGAIIYLPLLLAALGSDQKYESEIIKLLDAVPVDARDGVFMACEALNTPAICRKLMEKFTLWIKADPDYGNSTGEGGNLVDFIALWQKTQDRKSLDDFTAFCRKNWCGWEEK